MTDVVPPDQRDRQASASERRRRETLADQARAHRATLERSLQRIVYFATVTDDALDQALELGPTWRFALTADPTYEPTEEQVTKLRAEVQDRLVVWAQPLEVDAERCRAFAAILGTTGPPILQAEDQPQLEAALVAGTDRIVGNPNAWDPAERETDPVTRRLFHARHGRPPAIELAEQGLIAVAGECYTNVDGPWPNTYSSQGVPVASIVIGVGRWAEATRDLQPTDYELHTAPGSWQTISAYAASYITDWTRLPR